MNTKTLRGKDFVDLRDYTAEDIETIMHVAFDLKARLAAGERSSLLANRTLGMLFCAASTRTRVGFETAMDQLGGHAQFYAPEHLQLGGAKESWIDTTEVLARFVDGIMIRLSNIVGQGYDFLKYGESHAILQTMAKHSCVPIYNANDDTEHPTQVMADLMTFREKLGHEDYKKKKIALVWVCSKKGITPGIPHDMALVAGKLGMNLTIAHPEGFDLDPAYLNEGIRAAKLSGGTINIVHSIEEATKDASIVYAKGWGGPCLPQMTAEEDQERRKSLKHWILGEEHFKNTTKGAIFMNAMPLTRDVDVTSEVVDGPRSVIYDQAENRLHAQKAILAVTMP